MTAGLTSDGPGPVASTAALISACPPSSGAWAGLAAPCSSTQELRCRETTRAIARGTRDAAAVRESADDQAPRKPIAHARQLKAEAIDLAERPVGQAKPRPHRRR